MAGSALLFDQLPYGLTTNLTHRLKGPNLHDKDITVTLLIYFPDKTSNQSQ